MTILLVQIFLLMLASFLLGASVACLTRRGLNSLRAAEPPANDGPSLSDSMVPGVSSPAPAAAGTAGSERFERALTGDSSAVPLPFQSTRAPVVEVQAPPAPALETSPAPPTTQAASPIPEPPPAQAAEPAPQPEPPEVAEPALAPSPPQPPPVAEPVPVAAVPAEPAPAPSPTPVRSHGEFTAVAAAAAAAAAQAAAQKSAAQKDVSTFGTPPLAPPPAEAPAPPKASDDLLRIRAIDAETQRRLNVLGVYRFDEIAAWSPSDVTRISQSLGFYGRIEHENWIEQAQILSRGGETHYSKSISVPDTVSGPAETAAAGLAAAEAVADEANGASRDVSGLRSVRSEALRKDGGGQEALPHGVDDLKRIRGVGILIEKRLNSLGITSYGQIANWTLADIDRVSQVLDFKGRIERENWVEQARILSSGGHTDFSRRADRGEI